MHSLMPSGAGCVTCISRTRDRGYVAVPNNHQAVILTFNSSLLLGLRVHWDSSYGLSGFDPAHVISALARGRFTAYLGFPITYTQLKEVDLSRYDLSRMRIWANTADASMPRSSERSSHSAARFAASACR